MNLMRINAGLRRALPDDLLLLACRLSIAGVFWLSGRTKVEGWFTLTDTTFLLFRQDYALPLIPPEIAAYLATTAEHALPVLLVLGLGTRLAALGVLGMTAVIQTFVYPSAWPTHLSWAAPMLQVAQRQHAQPHRDQIHRQPQSRRHVHHHQHADHEDQAEPVGERVAQALEARFLAGGPLGGAELQVDHADQRPVDDDGRDDQPHQELEGAAGHSVDAAVVDRQRRRQHHDVEHRRDRVAAERLEDQHEGAAAAGDLLPGVERQQDGQGADVEDEDAVDDLVGRARNAVARVVGLGGGDAHQLQAAVGEHDPRHGHRETRRAVGEETAVLPEIGHGRLGAAVAADQEPQAETDHPDDGQYLDDGEPELGLAVRLHAGEVDQVDQREEDQRRDPVRHVRPPVAHVDADGGELRHAHQDVEEPVVPAGEEAGEGAEVLVGEVAEGAGDGLVDDHFAELPHDEEGHHAGQRVTQQDRGAGELDGRGDAQEQAGTDRAAQRDQLDVAVFQAALEVVGLGRWRLRRGGLHGSGWGGGGGGIFPRSALTPKTLSPALSRKRARGPLRLSRSPQAPETLSPALSRKRARGPLRLAANREARPPFTPSPAGRERAGERVGSPAVRLLQIQRIRQVAHRLTPSRLQRIVTLLQTRQRRQTEAPRDQPQHRRRVVLRVIHRPHLRERRDHQRRNPRARSDLVALGRRDVVPLAAVLVVGHDDHHVLPLRAGLQLGHQVGDLLVRVGDLTAGSEPAAASFTRSS
ncbi:doxX domain-containing protein [Ditylenchus destructor]|nr:doxX domain-containing protein [Ditylenchus destructor]